MHFDSTELVQHLGEPSCQAFGDQFVEAMHKAYGPVVPYFLGIVLAQ